MFSPAFWDLVHVPNMLHSIGICIWLLFAHKYMCVCVHIYIYYYIHMYTYVYIYMYVHVYLYIHVYMYISIHIYIYVHIFTYLYIYMYISLHMYIYIYIHPNLPMSKLNLPCNPVTLITSHLRKCYVYPWKAILSSTHLFTRDWSQWSQGFSMLEFCSIAWQTSRCCALWNPSCCPLALSSLWPAGKHKLKDMSTNNIHKINLRVKTSSPYKIQNQMCLWAPSSYLHR